MLIKEYDLKDELIVEIGKFAVLWNLYEKKYCNCHATPAKIIEVCESISVSVEKQSALAKALNDRRMWFEQLYTDFIVGGLYSDSRQPKQEEINHIEAFLKQEDNTICGCLLCVSRIRNNMMHGLKDVRMLNDQLEIFKATNGVLESL